ncbi:MAG: DUF4136 domain-containing protein [Gammaproteobacteria bacterium]|nr:DUF4136 domain-containing protein [Gammaproteobacteria bacterium]
MYILRWAGIAACALLVVGCESFRVQTDYDRQLSVAGWRTYAWMQQEPVTAPEGATAFGNPINQRRVREALEMELAAKGLQRVDDAAQADAVVRWAIGTRERPYGSDPRWSVGMGWGWGWHRHGWGSALMFDNSPYTITEARLAVDLFDARSKDAVWHGAVSLDAGRLSGEAAAVQIRKAVHKLMERYPPGSAPPQK